jgi:predicted dehydrogenase
LKVLFVGLGGIGQRHVRNLRTILGDQIEILAFRTRKLPTVLTDRLEVEAGSDLASKYTILSYDNLSEAINQRPQAVFICNPTSLHVPVALQAAHAGCHLFIEKPLSNDQSGLDELQTLVTQKNLVVYVAYQMRFHPCLQKAHVWLSTGRIGPIIAGRSEVGDYLPGWHTYEDYRQMYSSRRELGGGVILSQIHEMDTLYWFFGLPERIFTLGGHLSSLEIDVEDTASTLMGFRVNSRLIPIHLHQDYLQRPPSRTLQLVGDRGKILVDLAGLTARCYDQEGKLAEEATFEGFQRNQLFMDEINHFLACMRGEMKPQVSLVDGRQSLRMALAALESMETGKVVELE